MAEMKRITRKKKTGDVDALYESVMTCQPLFDKPTMYEIEKVFESVGFNQSRRMALAIATMGGDFYNKVAENRETAVLAAGGALRAKEQAKKLRALCEVFEAVHTRTTVALCNHQDMKAILREGKRI